jgi:hypothetical protein
MEPVQDADTSPFAATVVTRPVVIATPVAVVKHDPGPQIGLVPFPWVAAVIETEVAVPVAS